MKKISLLLTLSFGLLVQADPSEIETGAQNKELAAAELAQAGLSAAEQAIGPQDQDQESSEQEDVDKNEQSAISPTKKNGSRHIKSLLAGLACGVVCEIADAYAWGAFLNRKNRISGGCWWQPLSDREEKALAAAKLCLTAAEWSIIAARVALPTMVLKKLYKEKKDVKYTKSTIAKSAALAAAGTCLTWTNLRIKLGLI